MRNFVVMAAIILTVASAAGWAQSTMTMSSPTLAGSGTIDLFDLQSDAKDLPAPMVDDLI